MFFELADLRPGALADLRPGALTDPAVRAAISARHDSVPA